MNISTDTFTAEELAAFQSQAETSLTDTATILRRTGLAANGLGGTSGTWTAIGTVACRLVKTSTADTERVEAGEMKSVTPWWCAFPVGTDVQAPDRVVVNGATYEVESTDSGLSQAALLTAHLKLISR